MRRTKISGRGCFTLRAGPGRRERFFFVLFRPSGRFDFVGETIGGSYSISVSVNTSGKECLTLVQNCFKFCAVMAKQRKSPKSRRDQIINFAVSAEEKKIFLGLAEQRRTSFAEMVRQMLFREAGTTSKVA